MADQDDMSVNSDFQRANSRTDSPANESTVDEDVNQFDILIQSIPYYAMGQPKTDALVRATLMHLDDEVLEATDEGGNTLLMLACQHRHEDLVRILLQKGANANATNSSGACCLHFPCYMETCSMPIAKALLQAGANPEIAESSYGCTPLHYCASIGDVTFCKLLISYGALVGTRDFYDYTAVDYAREANMEACTSYLQKLLISSVNEGVNGFATMGGQSSVRQPSVVSPSQEPVVEESEGGTQFTPKSQSNFEQHGSIAVGVNGNGGDDMLVPGTDDYLQRDVSAVGFDTLEPRNDNYEESSKRLVEDAWERHVDPASDGVYFINHYSGECLWEEDYIELMNQKPNLLAHVDRQQEHLEPTDELVLSITRGMSKRKLNIDTDVPTPKLKEKSETPASQAQLKRADTLKGIGRMDVKRQFKLLSETTMRESMMDMLDVDSPRKGAMNSSVESSEEKEVVKMVDANSVRKLVAEVKLAAAEVQEKERLEFRTTLSENNGKIVKLEAEVERLKSENNFLQSKLADLNSNQDQLSSENASQLKEATDSLAIAEKDKVALRAELKAQTNKLEIAEEKLAALEGTMANLESGHGAQIEEVKRLTEEQNERLAAKEKEHAAAIQAKEDEIATLKSRVAAQLKKLKAKAQDTAKAHEDEITKLRAEYEEKISTLNNDMVETKAKLVQDLSNAELLADANNRRALEAEEAANEAKELAKNYEAEVLEMREVKKQNQKLLIDFNKEQLIRKRLHNEIEDMKGKIRVYVRVRPFSNSEAERGCSEAVIKDGKQSVCVKGAQGKDSKKSYEFDSVFAGMAKEGNSQEDVFTDTKHLITSVVDGYNVCIFAYGQTGAGELVDGQCFFSFDTLVIELIT